jgi:hypothetical protein
MHLNAISGKCWCDVVCHHDSTWSGMSTWAQCKNISVPALLYVWRGMYCGMSTWQMTEHDGWFVWCGMSGWEGVDLAHALERDSWKMLVWWGMSGWFDMKWYVILSKMLEWLGDSIVICVTWNAVWYVKMRLGVLYCKMIAQWLVCVMWYVRMSGTWFDEWMIEWVKEW